MDLQKIKDKASRYVLDRACSSGGFCFYRLDEPNPQDTYFAITTLHLLHVPYHDERTVQYLQSLQRADGGYESLAQTFFVILSLNFLRNRPLKNPVDGIKLLTNNILSFSFKAEDAPCSLPYELYQLTVLYEKIKLDWQKGQQEAIKRLLHSGFGIKSPTLLEILPAVVALRNIRGAFMPELIEPFLRYCEHPVLGFTGKPETSLYYLEYVHAGLALCDELSLFPTYAQACASFFFQCQNNSGGFARSCPGIATLENTYFAVHGITILEQMGVL